jgi:hypothetical protein
MARRITLNDFGRLIKPKILTEAFILCNQDKVDPYNWWYHSLHFNQLYPSYKRDMLISIYGERLEKLFANLPLNSYVAEINSFLVFFQRKYQFVTNPAQAQQIMQSGKKWSIRAVGVKLYKSYDSSNKTVKDVWEYDSQTISWYFRLHHILPIEEVELYNSIEVGDMVFFKKTQAFVTTVKNINRRKWWNKCSWTDKRITVLSGSLGRQFKLNTNRPYQIIKPKKP